jgi:hypothetical protein
VEQYLAVNLRAYTIHTRVQSQYVELVREAAGRKGAAARSTA